MLSEYKLIQFLDDVLLVFWVLLIQSFDQFGFDKTLLVETFLILEDF